MSLYSDLLKKSLLNLIYSETEPNDTTWGRCWPKHATTMIGLPRLLNIEQCVEFVIANNVPGDFLEAGVWRGGAAILMRGLLKERNITGRNVWLADSFKGLPKPQVPQDTRDMSVSINPELAVSLKIVKQNFNRYGLLDGQVKFVEGWYADTLPPAGLDRLAILRCDCDYYLSTMQVLDTLYDRVAKGGIIIVDDYGEMPQCRQAVDAFRRRRGITTQLVWTDHSCVHWQK